MIERQKVVVLELTPQEYKNRASVIADYVLSQYRSSGWISTKRTHLRAYQFDANYNSYYIKLRFEKSTF